MDLTRTAEQLVDRALLLLGVSVLRPPAMAGTKTLQDVTNRALAKLGVSVLRPPSLSGTKTRNEIVDRAMVKLNVAVLRPPAMAGTKTINELADRILAKLNVSVLRPPAMAGTKNSDALILRVLKKLQVVGDGQGASAEEAANLRLLIDPVVDGLAQRGIVNISNIEAIPEAYFEPLADVLALEHAPDHGKATDQGLVAFALKAESDLKAMAAIALADTALPAILSTLAQRAVVSITNTAAIPQSYVEPLADIGAVSMAGQFGKTADANLIALAVKAESDLKAMALVDLADASVDPVLSGLAQRGIVSVAGSDTIPQAYFEALADILAANLTKSAGKSDQDYVALAAKAEADLKAMSGTSLVDAAIPPIVASLAQRGIVNITDTATIAQAYFEPLVDIMISNVAGQFGKAADQTLLPLAAKAEADLKVMARIDQVDDMVDGLVADLYARRIVAIEDTEEIPIAVFEGTAKVLALNAAPIFDKPIDEAAILLAESKLRTKFATEPTYEVQRATYY